MARKAGGGLRPHIQAGNSYEKRLLPEVVHPDDSGIGFAEVSQSWQHCLPRVLSLTGRSSCLPAVAGE